MSIFFYKFIASSLWQFINFFTSYALILWKVKVEFLLYHISDFYQNILLHMFSCNFRAETFSSKYLALHTIRQYNIRIYLLVFIYYQVQTAREHIETNQIFDRPINIFD